MQADVPLELVQSEILVAALTGRPLPGLGHPSVLADLDLLVGEDGTVYILDDEFAPGVDATVRAELTRHPADTGVRDLRTVSIEEARRLASESGLAFLRFRSPEPMADGVRLVLEMCAVRHARAPVSTLGALIVTYGRDDTGWHPAGPPIQLAT